MKRRGFLATLPVLGFLAPRVIARPVPRFGPGGYIPGVAGGPLAILHGCEQILPASMVRTLRLRTASRWVTSRWPSA